jgi:hypothetical protein
MSLSPRARRARNARRRATVWHFIGLLIVFLTSVFPFYWMVTTSLKSQADALAVPPVWFFTPTLAHYTDALFEHDVAQSLLNSLIVASSATFLSLVLVHLEPDGEPGRARGAVFPDRHQAGYCRYAHRADPAVSHVLAAHCRMDLH